LEKNYIHRGRNAGEGIDLEKMAVGGEKERVIQIKDEAQSGAWGVHHIRGKGKKHYGLNLSGEKKGRVKIEEINLRDHKDIRQRSRGKERHHHCGGDREESESGSNGRKEIPREEGYWGLKSGAVSPPEMRKM